MYHCIIMSKPLILLFLICLPRNIHRTPPSVIPPAPLRQTYIPPTTAIPPTQYDEYEQRMVTIEYRLAHDSSMEDIPLA